MLPAALAREPSYWPAHLHAALLYLEKFNEADAAVEIVRGLAINPNAAELHAARAELALLRFDLSSAKASTDRALEINSELIWAHQLRADWFLADLRLEEAGAVLQEALALNARDEQTLGRLLAVYVASDRSGNRSRADGRSSGIPCCRQALATSRRSRTTLRPAALLTR